MGLLSKAKWITSKDFINLEPINVFHKEHETLELPLHKEELKNNHMFVRKRFILEDDFKKAFIHITADDSYKLYINGEFVGSGPAQSYYFNYYYNTYEISKFLKKGENVIAVHVYYQGLINRVFNSGDYRQGMMASLFVDDVHLFSSDSSFKYTTTKAYEILHKAGYETQFMERLNHNNYEDGWKSCVYDDSSWENAVERNNIDYKFVEQTTKNIQHYNIEPMEVKEVAKNHFIIDFGQEIAGQFKMTASGPKGEIVEIRSGEELTEDGSVRYQLRCNCVYKEEWVLSDVSDATLEFFDYKAFRYVEVIGNKALINVNSFMAEVCHYPFDDSICTFTSSNEVLNRIWQICKNAVKYGTMDKFMDCPTREKGQYLGDNTVIAHSHMYLSGDTSMFRKALEDFIHSSFICKGIMGVAPGSFMQEVADYSLQFPYQLLLYYKFSGDYDFLLKAYPYAKEMMNYFKSYEREDYLLQNVYGKWNLVDWPENLRDGYDFNLTRPVSEGCHIVINAFYYGALKDMQEIGRILGKDEKYNMEGFKSSFLKAFYRENVKLFADSEISNHSALHSNVLPLLFGLNPKESTVNIVEFIKNKGFSCGVYMSYFILNALAKAGEYELIYNMIVNDSKASWVNMVREGATTCFEAWGKDQKWNTSLCHPWASAPIPILIEHIFGISPSQAGFKDVIFKPHFPQSITDMGLELKINNKKYKISYENGICDTMIEVMPSLKL